MKRRQDGKAVVSNACECVSVSRDRREVLDVGAHQEGARAAPPQPQEEENHLQLYYWSVLKNTLNIIKRSQIGPNFNPEETR